MRALEYWNKSSVRKLFSQWVDFAKKRKHEQNRLEEAHKHWMKKTTLKCICLMKRFTADQKERQRMKLQSQALWSEHTLRNVWRLWQHHHEQYQHDDDIARTHEVQSSLRMFYTKWKLQWRYLIDMRALVHRFETRSNDKKKENVFHTLQVSLHRISCYLVDQSLTVSIQYDG
jgi:hypothetical protein